MRYHWRHNKEHIHSLKNRPKCDCIQHLVLNDRYVHFPSKSRWHKSSKFELVRPLFRSLRLIDIDQSSIWMNHYLEAELTSPSPSHPFSSFSLHYFLFIFLFTSFFPCPPPIPLLPFLSFKYLLSLPSKSA